MLGDPTDPLSVEGEPIQCKEVLSDYLAGVIDIYELNLRLDQLIPPPPSLADLFAAREADTRRSEAEDAQRERLQAMLDHELARQQTIKLRQRASDSFRPKRLTTMFRHEAGVRPG